MDLPAHEIAQLYGGAVRVRVCGICVSGDSVLLVNHRMYEGGAPFWSPPGGGIAFGEPAVAALKREFLEETGLDVEVGEMLFVNEHIRPPLHAVELFFEITSFKGDIQKGSDPELGEQVIQEVRFVSFEEIRKLPPGEVHAALTNVSSVSELLKLRSMVSPGIEGGI